MPNFLFGAIWAQWFPEIEVTLAIHGFRDTYATIGAHLLGVKLVRLPVQPRA
jgi:hypothetical protein